MLLTLVVPVMYLLVDSAKARVVRLLGRRSKAQGQPE
jgi:hypothetical protein